MSRVHPLKLSSWFSDLLVVAVVEERGRATTEVVLERGRTSAADERRDVGGQLDWMEVELQLGRVLNFSFLSFKC